VLDDFATDLAASKWLTRFKNNIFKFCGRFFHFPAA
jgi:hypothetical protein